MAVTARTVVVLRALGLGDLLTGVPALRGIRRAWPDSRIVLAAPASLGDLLPLIGAVDELSPTAALSSFSWSGGRPDGAVNLHGSGPQSIEAVRSTGTQIVLTHHHADYPDIDGPLWISGQHEVRRWCQMLRYYGIDSDPHDLFLPDPAENSRAPGAILIHPGASHPARRWPEKRFAEVVRWLAHAGNAIVITGNQAEQPMAHRVAAMAGLPRDVVLAGETRLAELAALVAHARLVICGDTGIAHLATAYRTPSVSLFGPVSPAQWGPPNDPRHAVLWAGTVGDPFAGETDSGLLRLSVEMVKEAVRGALESRHLIA